MHHLIGWFYLFPWWWAGCTIVKISHLIGSMTTVGSFLTKAGIKSCSRDITLLLLWTGPSALTTGFIGYNCYQNLFDLRYFWEGVWRKWTMTSFYMDAISFRLFSFRLVQSLFIHWCGIRGIDEAYVHIFFMNQLQKHSGKPHNSYQLRVKSTKSTLSIQFSLISVIVTFVTR